MIYNDLALFTTVAHHLSFSDAAQQLDIPPSRVSRRIAELEDHLDTKLFERTTRQVRLTVEGRRLLDRCQSPIEELQDVAGFADDIKRHTIRITAPPLAARTTIGPRLLEFAAQNPDVSFDVVTTNAMLDFFRDNIDIAFRLGPLVDSSLVAKRLWSVPYSFCIGAGLAEDLGLNLVTIDEMRALPAITSRQPWILENGEQIRPSNVVHAIDDLDLVAAAARKNLGVALLPSDMITEGLHPLRLKDTAPMQRDMFSVYPSRRLMPGRLRRLIDFMTSD
ncbi:MAG: LysR family transcriptional regulator [Pelagimonas sp.]|jgi:DNA-binding transcriptional LysR family regulator|nr:LysR family transcriptional regulator [Pelagimonas sp.]